MDIIKQIADRSSCDTEEGGTAEPGEESEDEIDGWNIGMIRADVPCESYGNLHICGANATGKERAKKRK